MKRLFILLSLFIATPVYAQGDGGPSFSWPLSCALGTDCWINHYMDRDPTAGVADYNCGHLTYEGHDGTDITIRDRNQQVDVLAAADGVIINTRNDQPDHDGGKINTEPTRESRTECGNAVTMDNGNGWRTFYCHMRQGSVTVVPGQQVARGEKIGEVGQSGLADFPHLHIEVLKGKVSIDPFTADAAAGCGTATGATLWDSDIPYDPAPLYAAGFRTAVPAFEEVMRDTSSPEALKGNPPSLIFWVAGIGSEPGDRLRIQILDPDGKVFANSDSQLPRKIRYMHYTGRALRTIRLQRGTYTGVAVLTRTYADGQTIERNIQQTIEIR